MFAANIKRNTALSNTAVAVVGDKCTLYGYYFFNPNSVPVYVKFYDALVTNVTVGTTIPAITRMVPAQSGWLAQENNVQGQLNLQNGLTVACTTSIADSDTTAPASAIYSEFNVE